jgi:hypothetical protein
MASITTSKRTGRKRLLFLDNEGDRRTIGLGNMKGREANEIKAKVESIIAAQKVCMDPPPVTLKWLGEIPDALHKQLARVGLVSPRVPEPPPEAAPVVTIEAFINDYIRRRTEAKTKERTILKAPPVVGCSYEVITRQLSYREAARACKELNEWDKEDWSKVTREALLPPPPPPIDTIPGRHRPM